jgi:aminoglycoside phosphotransferase (APT) family kinase protein
MLDYNTKFDRRESTSALDEQEIRGLVRSHLGGSEIESVSVLTGGFVNSNYHLVLRDHRSLVLRITARSGDLKKELRVLKHVQGAVRVPAVVAEDFSGAHPFALLEFIEGALLSDSLGSLDAVDLTRVAFEAGISLQAIHSFDLGTAGFFDENFVFDPAFENFGGGLYEYICSSLASGRVRERLGENLAAQALEYVGASGTNTGRFLVPHV